MVGCKFTYNEAFVSYTNTRLFIKKQWKFNIDNYKNFRILIK